MGLPSLIVVCGPFGAGKTTLAHALAREVGCPAICRDEIKEGMVHAQPGFTPSPGDELTQRTFGVFFDVLELLLRAEVSVVAEAAFRGPVWQPRLERLAEIAQIRIVECVLNSAVARGRQAHRQTQSAIRRAAHVPVSAGPSATQFEPIALDVPKLRVDTSDGYAPGLAAIVAFIKV